MCFQRWLMLLFAPLDLALAAFPPKNDSSVTGLSTNSSLTNSSLPSDSESAEVLFANVPYVERPPIAFTPTMKNGHYWVAFSPWVLSVINQGIADFKNCPISEEVVAGQIPVCDDSTCPMYITEQILYQLDKYPGEEKGQLKHVSTWNPTLSPDLENALHVSPMAFLENLNLLSWLSYGVRQTITKAVFVAALNGWDIANRIRKAIGDVHVSDLSPQKVITTFSCQTFPTPTTASDCPSLIVTYPYATTTPFTEKIAIPCDYPGCKYNCPDGDCEPLTCDPGLKYEFCPCNRGSPYAYSEVMSDNAAFFAMATGYQKMGTGPACVAKSQVQKGYTITSCVCDGKPYSPISGATASPCLYTASSDLPTKPYVRPTVTPWDFDIYTGDGCLAAHSVTPTPAVTMSGTTTIGCQSYPSEATVMDISVDTSACVRFFVTPGCGGEPKTSYCNTVGCYYVKFETPLYEGFDVVPATIRKGPRIIFS